MLDHQLPVLVSFVFLRLAGIFTVTKALYAVTPARVRAHVETAADWFMRFRRIAMSCGLASLVLQILYAPPEGVCQEYGAIKAQGTSALISLAVLMTTNNALGSAVAIAALRAVASTSASSIVLASSAAVISSSGTDTLLFTYCLFWVAMAHAVWCYSDNSARSTATHGSIITMLALIFNVILYLAALLYRRIVNVVSAMLRGSMRMVRVVKQAVD